MPGKRSFGSRAGHAINRAHHNSMPTTPNLTPLAPVYRTQKALIMMLMSSISDVGRCCCKWVENRSRFRSSNAELGLAIMSGLAAACVEGGESSCFLLFSHDSCNLWRGRESNDPTHPVDLLKFHRRQLLDREMYLTTWLST
jgi:hypothetical protein